MVYITMIYITMAYRLGDGLRREETRLSAAAEHGKTKFAALVRDKQEALFFVGAEAYATRKDTAATGALRMGERFGLAIEDKSKGPMLRPVEFAASKKAVDEFIKPGGVGEKLQNKLIAKREDPKTKNWIYEWWNDGAYLSYRDPVVPYVVTSTHIDLWFRSGDLFKLDGQGRLYFIDRLGDTFRWHSENVSTTEVGDVLGTFPQVAEANVYGVLVPNTGRLVRSSTSHDDVLNGNKMDFAALAAHCLEKLPRYAVPLFVRVTKNLDYTGTHKVLKGKLRSEGIDLSAIKESSDDQMYWLSPGSQAYVPFEKKDFDGLKAGKVRL
ncbi:hypothetical protein NUW58_g9219 [Xylaria curta]|uniref:Uncharacterized protein n=1 Tax=Xylaria curta TaxID=42375 RepID=A0ACC1N0X4_9PEZI|nr:hypothetical protein NUW58_g9219 [Xylaria curta]